MNLNDYAALAMWTAIYPRGFANSHSGLHIDIGLTYAALKLSGEAGEFAQHLGKALRDSGGMLDAARREAMKAELGDILWYLAACARELGVDLEEVAQANLEKLASREERGVLQGAGDAR